ncbi:benzoate 4-monooxygenase cytochrome P450 [Paraphoma chrysanthemicola]|uniref:Benzoate 4-monooxygenase cytochrome P450 n=1 Tax=Paraphoma chrysanthemicola TaxID=798071 RepID=A0A8K0RDI5_9PLEO|nr:benzoate 4-monooxygenase cytochrome P450 [Paraphoma chrysanthemicola]
MARILILSSTLVAVVLGYYLSRAIYNLFFHPLAKFPGPWWASASYLAEFYYDVVQGGRYFAVIARMHEQYGPLIRINPDELHLNDPFFYEHLYAGSGQKRNKDKNNAVLSGTTLALNTTLDHNLHRERRGYIASFFSKQSTQRLEPFIQGQVKKLVEKLRQAHDAGDTIVGIQIFGALTCDIITHYAYGESFGELDKAGFPCQLERDATQLLLSGHFRRFLPAVAGLLQRLPERWITWLNPAVATFFDLERKITDLCHQARQRQDMKVSNSDRTIFDALTGPNVPEQEKSLARLKDESQLVLFAGLDTTARALTAMVCYMATYPDVLAKLRTELQSAWVHAEDQPSWRRFARVPVEPLPYKESVIPAGTSVGAMPWLLNRHPDVFPDPDVFRPERWLDAARHGQNLTRYLVTFSKGSRMCLGINLAYAEMYIAVAALVHNFDMELVDSTIKNIIPYRDYALSFDEDYSYGVNFKVAKVLHS